MANDPVQIPNYGRPKKGKSGTDVAALGLLIGIAFPILGIVVLYFLWSTSGTFGDYLHSFVSFNNAYEMNKASKVLSLSMIANLVPFYYFLNKKQYLAVRGILISMVLFFLLFVMYRFVWS
ncbi:hypothetical protein F0919_04720 [Taibaiella lutea]|uniref:Uncharacterized protein n=1 Tax=Taibaiella lutea TaxID=2608001 RepID=A0A5M6CPF6_9BACT|nr:hypothetical protein [Taibaiella lutea]KAA5536977.1 hypothetical protein F0919_04720 [Taibaiella lutea]